MIATAALGIPWTAGLALAVADGRRRAVGLAALAALVATFGAVLWIAVRVAADGPVEVTAGSWPAGIGVTLRVDELGAIFALLSLGVLIAALAHEVAAGVESRAFPALVVFMAAGLTGLFVTGDVFSFYVFFELSMISAYVLTTYGNEARQVGAALVFAVANLLGSFVFLIGVAALYHITGTLEMRTVAARIDETTANSAILIAVSFFVAFGVKLGLFPFHFWLPRVYSGSRPAVAAVLSGALANIGAYGLIRFGAGILPRELALGSVVLLAIGAASIVYGAVQAVGRRNPTEVLAYSVIGQAGYVLVALAIGGAVGIAAAIVYAVANALTKGALFLAVGMRGPFVAGAFAVGAFSVAGVPPTVGFFAKVEVFRAAAAGAGPAVVSVLALGSVLSFVYLFQVYQRWFWRGENEDLPHAGAGPRLAAAGLAVLVLALGIWPEPLLEFAHAAAAGLPGARR